ncbi:MAG: ATP-binding protein [Myxococcota bacterium]|nr:ATP-binding protein [Myxococcota bacterium]
MTVTTELLTAAEGRTLDWKRDLSSPRPILRTLVAFANTAGGTLIVGRDDDGALCGVPDPKKAADWLANIIADGIAPALFPDIETETVDGKHLVIVRVARWIGPFHVVADGKERGTYVRLGATNRHADERTLEELNRQARQQAFDELPCLGAEIADLDQAALAKAFAAKGREMAASSCSAKTRSDEIASPACACAAPGSRATPRPSSSTARISRASSSTPSTTCSSSSGATQGSRGASRACGAATSPSTPKSLCARPWSTPSRMPYAKLCISDVMPRKFLCKADSQKQRKGFLKAPSCFA